MVLQERPDGVRLVRITRPEEAIAYRASFAGVYQDIWSEPPYNERWSSEEAEGVLQSYLQTPEQITILAVRGQSSVVAFGVAVPLSSRPDVARELRGLVPTAHTFYLAELGVLGSHRRSGLGRELIRQRLRLVERPRYSNVVLRTSAVRNASYDMYMELGFHDMGVYMEVGSLRQDGRVSTDRRLFLSRVLPAHDPLLDEDPAPR